MPQQQPQDLTATPSFQVVVNHEEQYSIWPDGMELPIGWSAVGMSGTKEACLAYIEEVWTDMRPLSLRVKLRAVGAENLGPCRNPAKESDQLP